MRVLPDSDEGVMTGTPIAGSGRVLDNPVPAREAGAARMWMPLEISIPGHATYTVRHVFNASLMRVALLPGTEIPVEVDSDDRTRLVIAWQKVTSRPAPSRAVRPLS